MEEKKGKLSKENYNPEDLKMSKKGIEKTKIIKEYLKKESEKEKQLQKKKHNENIQKLREHIETITRIHHKGEAKKKKQIFEEMMRDMHYRIGMKMALNIIEGKDDNE